MGRIELATKIANELRELADIVDQAGRGEATAMTLLGSYIDGYHYGIVVGQNEVQALTTNGEEE